MAPRLTPLLSPPIGFGRVGDADHAPDSSAEGFALTVRLGATGIEADVWMTADQVVVLGDDSRVRSGLRSRRIGDLRLDQLPEPRPTLADLYRVVGTDFPVSLQLRTPVAFRPVIEAARAAGGNAEQNLWLCHPDPSELMVMRPETEAKLVNSTALKSLTGGAERRAAELADLGIDALSLFHREWSGGLVALLHRFGRFALGRGARHEREMAKLLDAGIDAVYSDHVDRMVAVIDAFYQS